MLKTYDPTDRIIAQAMEFGFQLHQRHEEVQRRKRMDNLMMGLGFSVVVNVLAICGYLIGWM